MKAPDKIYLIPFGKPIKEPYPDDDGTTIWSSNPFGNTNAGNIAYIRKDALLEWLRAKHMELDPPGNERAFGHLEAVEEFTEKLQSL